MSNELDLENAEGEYEVSIDPSVLTSIKKEANGVASKKADSVFTLRCK
jgi:hypothetical protein